MVSVGGGFATRPWNYVYNYCIDFGNATQTFVPLLTLLVPFRIGFTAAAAANAAATAAAYAAVVTATATALRFVRLQRHQRHLADGSAIRLPDVRTDWHCCHNGGHRCGAEIIVAQPLATLVAAAELLRYAASWWQIKSNTNWCMLVLYSGFRADRRAFSVNWPQIDRGDLIMKRLLAEHINTHKNTQH